MKTVYFPYGKKGIEYRFDQHSLVEELVPSTAHIARTASPEQLIEEAVKHPIGTLSLRQLSQNKRRVTILISDHTRPVPSRLILPVLLHEIRAGNPEAQIILLVATGCHRATTDAELEAKLGKDILDKEKIVIHDCDGPMKYCGKLPSGGELWLNPLAVETDLLVAEGFIEPHFFAGFSGGRKSVLPGVSGRSTVMYNHNAQFIAHPKARAGVLDGNPVHADMQYAARAAKLAFICNVILDEKKKVIHAVAGDCVEAHRAGCDYLYERCCVPKREADIVIVSNGGYPLDQNLYQAVKGLSTACEAVKKGGIIIMLAESSDGCGGDAFYKAFQQEKDLEILEKKILSTPPENTGVDQWQTQILLRVLRRATVIYVSSLSSETTDNFHMIPASTLEEAMQTASRLSAKSNPSVAVIPDGVSLIMS